MTPQNFDEILRLIKDDITKINTNMHDSIPANIKLAARICLDTTINCTPVTLKCSANFSLFLGSS